MIICPDCGNENIEGIDSCEACGQSLSELSFRLPATPIEVCLVSDRIETLDPKTPLTVRPDAPVAEVLRQMVEQRVGCVIILEGERLAGIFSERDALFRLDDNAAAMSDHPISEFMTPDPEALRTDDTIAFALHKMDLGGYRHLPILSDGRVTGIISVRDILSYLTDRIAQQAATP